MEQLSFMQDIILSIIFGAGLAAGGVAMAIFAPDWDDYFNDDYNPIDAKRIHNSMIASAVSYFTCTLTVIKTVLRIS